MKKYILGFGLLSIFASCTDNQRARSYGGTEEIKLEPGEKFINITWKKDNMWVITEKEGVYYAREKSSYGIWEGTIIVHPVILEQGIKVPAGTSVQDCWNNYENGKKNF